MPHLTRRELLKAAALAPAAAAGAVPLVFVRDAAAAPGANPPRYLDPTDTHYLTQAEKAFVDAAAARIIPADDLGPGAHEANVATFIDRQLAGPYGRAETWYMLGPWKNGTKQQGYQLRLTPAELYRTAIRDIEAHVKKAYGKDGFAQLAPDTQDGVLRGLEHRDVQLPHAPGDVFFETLRQNTVEGFLADPMYGGNRDFIGWKLIGFPGPRYNYVAEIDQYGVKYDLPFVSIAGRDTGVERG